MADRYDPMLNIAKDALIHLLTFTHPPSPDSAYIHDSPQVVYWQPNLAQRPDLVGVRVAEIDFPWHHATNPNLSGGSSYMQVDLPHGLAVCAAAERFVLEVTLAGTVNDEEVASCAWRVLLAIVDDDAVDGLFKKWAESVGLEEARQVVD